MCQTDEVFSNILGNLKNIKHIKTAELLSNGDVFYIKLLTNLGIPEEIRIIPSYNKIGFFQNFNVVGINFKMPKFKQTTTISIFSHMFEIEDELLKCISTEINNVIYSTNREYELFLLSKNQYNLFPQKGD
jgi:hypothetical protein